LFSSIQVSPANVNRGLSAEDAAANPIWLMKLSAFVPFFTNPDSF
jgi:hypothetical protein